MEPWAKGGATDSDNLIILCKRHHRLTHEGGWKVEGEPDQELRFIRPSGGVLRTGPPPVRPEIRARLPVLFGEENGYYACRLVEEGKLHNVRVDQIAETRTKTEHDPKGKLADERCPAIWAMQYVIPYSASALKS